jgi:hypothetical protein
MRLRLCLLVFLCGCASAPPPAKPSSCQALDDLRARHREQERLLRQARAADDEFPDGPRQPAAEAAIAKGLAAKLPAAYRLEGPDPVLCHPWVCKAAVSWINDPRPEPPAPDKLLGKDLIDAVPRWTYRHDIDPDGRFRQINTYVIILRSPDGASPAPAGDPAARVPADEDSCSAEIARLRPEVQSRDAELERRRLSTSGRYMRDPANPPLTAEMAALMREKLGLGPRPDNQLVECHAWTCKVLLPESDNTDLRPVLGNRDRLESGIVFSGGHRQRYLTVYPPDQQHSRALFRTLHEGVDGACSRCAKQQPARGGLTMTLQIPAAARLTAKDLRVSYAGSLVGTPRGRCVSQLVDEQLAAATRTEGPFAAATFWHDFLYGAR